MWSAALVGLSRVLSIVDKLLPDWLWKGGQATERAAQAQETADARKAMADVDRPDERDTTDKLRRGRY